MGREHERSTLTHQEGSPAPPPAAPGASPSSRGWHPPHTTNGFAVASLVLGIVWLMWVGSILALVFGYIGKSQIDRSHGAQDGRGMAIAGIVLGWVGVGLLGLMIALAALGFITMGSMMDQMPGMRMPGMPMPEMPQPGM